MSSLPVCTYRIQMQPSFGFAETTTMVGYLADLGVSAVYSSPFFAAERGSTHGYNVVDPTRLNPEIGDEASFKVLSAALKRKGLGLIVDFVPNHMGVSTDQNTWWNNVLENGPSATYAEFFDIDWSPPKQSLHNKVLLPVLGDQYGRVLEAGKLRVAREAGAFVLYSYDRALPIAPKTTQPIFEAAVRLAELGEQDDAMLELMSILSAVRNLPPPTALDPAARVERAREKEVIKRRTAALCASSAAVTAALDRAVATLNGTAGEARSFDALDALLREQNYRLSFWRVATEEINYRRFFDVNDLAAIRMEDPRVFESMHSLLLSLVRDGHVTGVRLDHTDGLFDPATYFETLQKQDGVAPTREATHVPAHESERPLYLLVEKILEPGEVLPTRWRVHGTTGYDFLRVLNGVLVDPRAEPSLTAFYRRFTGDTTPFRQHVFDAKRLVMASRLASEVNVLARALERLAESDRRSRDFTLGSLTAALSSTIAAFPVYRTYWRPDGGREDADERYLERAVRLARRRNRTIDPSVYAFLYDRITRKEPLDDSAEEALRVQFVMKLQQLTGPVTAKSLEDTAFYRYNRLISLNEVGADPEEFGVSVEEFHRANAERLRDWPFSMTASSTHDTKRGEDTRARVSVLSELPDEWRRAVSRWAHVARMHGYTNEFDGEAVPSRNDEYLFYQSYLGAFPFDASGVDRPALAGRLADYAVKAAREAKIHTSWTSPNDEYESALRAFADRAVGDDRIFNDVRDMAELIAPHAASNALAQCLLKLCAPGVPDIYQGSEGWNQSLVDPDNRAPVVVAALVERLAAVRAPSADAAKLLESYRDGAVKLFVTHRALAHRKRDPELFLYGSYEALAGGDHIVAFARSRHGRQVICCVPRLTYRLTRGKQPWALGDAWGDAPLRGTPIEPGARYTNVFTGERVVATDGTHRDGAAPGPDAASRGGQIALSQVLAMFPVALLERS